MCGLAIQSTSVLHSSSVSKQVEHPLLDHSGIINGCWMCSGLNILNVKPFFFMSQTPPLKPEANYSPDKRANYLKNTKSVRNSGFVL